jgi:hypothetical protein
MRDIDQRARSALMKAPAEEATLLKLVEVDRAHLPRMKTIVAEHGWPGKSLVGTDGAAAAWLLVQHADMDVEFQNRCLDLMEQSVRQGAAKAQHWAYLVDRVRVNRKQPQVYGTQFRKNDHGNYEPQPIEDEARVDERRKSVGLTSLAEYAERLRSAYAPNRAANAK